MDALTISVVFFGVMIYFFITAMIIREVAELFKHHDHSLHKSTLVAGALTAIIILQFFTKDIVWLNWTLVLAHLGVLYGMLKYVYGDTWQRTGAMFGVSIGFFLVALAILAAIVRLF